MLYIQPDECVDWCPCVPVCPVEAIYYQDDLPQALQPYTEENARFFTDVMPDRSAPLGSPGGAGRLGPLTVDTTMVADRVAELLWHSAARAGHWQVRARCRALCERFPLPY